MYLKLPIFYFWIVLIFSSQNAFGQDCTVPFSINYFQPFTELNDDDLPQCWLEADNGFPDGDGPIDFGSGGWRPDGFSNNGSEGAMRIKITSDSDQDWLISPTINIPTVGIQVDFDFAITSSSGTFPTVLGSDDEVRFLLSPDDGATWLTLQTWTEVDMVDPAGENKIYDLTAYSGMDLIFAFWGYEGTVDDDQGGDVFVDNFYVRTPPTCFVPLSTSVTGIGSVSANFNWIPSLGAETTWDIELVEAGSTPTGIPTAGYDDVTATSVSLQNLLPETSYDVYIRSDCGMDNASDISTWLGPINFTTNCAPFNAPYEETFLDTPGPFGGAAVCWQEANDGNLTDGPSNFGSGSWSVNDQFANAGDKSMRINLFQSGDVDWLLTPSFNLESNEAYQVAFDFAATNFLTTDPTNLGSDDMFVFLVSIDNGVSWTTLQTWTAADQIDPAGVEITHNISDFNGGKVNFAFWASEGNVDDPEDYEIFIDNFEITILPIAPLVASTLETNISCNGLTDGAIDLNVTGGLTPLTYLWSNGSTDEDISNLAAGDYTVTVTSSDDTVIETTVTITEPTVIEESTVVLDETVGGAADGSIDLTVSGGTPGYTFSWDNGATTEDLTGLDDGTYCVTIMDANNCMQTTCADVIAGPSSIQSISDLTNFRVYPNPVGNQKFIIDLEFSLAKDIEIQLINVFGQEVYKANHLNVSELKTELNAATFATGIYFIKVYSLSQPNTPNTIIPL